MALENIRHEVTMMLADVDDLVAQACGRLSKGPDTDKISAAGELAVLRQQRDVLTTRLREVDAASSDSSETLLEWIRQEGFNLRFRLSDWVSGH